MRYGSECDACNRMHTLAFSKVQVPSAKNDAILRAFTLFRILTSFHLAGFWQTILEDMLHLMPLAFHCDADYDE